MELYNFYKDTRIGMLKSEEKWFYAVGFYDKRRFPPKAPKILGESAGVLWIEDDTEAFLTNNKGSWLSIKVNENVIESIKRYLDMTTRGWKRNQFYDISNGGHLFFHILDDGSMQISRKKW